MGRCGNPACSEDLVEAGKQKDGGSDSDDPDDRQAKKLAHRAAAAGNLDSHGSDTDDSPCLNTQGMYLFTHRGINKYNLVYDDRRRVHRANRSHQKPSSDRLFPLPRHTRCHALSAETVCVRETRNRSEKCANTRRTESTPATAACRYLSGRGTASLDAARDGEKAGTGFPRTSDVQHFDTCPRQVSR
jgi:hypothetical protein